MPLCKIGYFTYKIGKNKQKRMRNKDRSVIIKKIKDIRFILSEKIMNRFGKRRYI